MKFCVNITFNGDIYINAENEEDARDRVKELTLSQLVNQGFAGTTDIDDVSKCEE